MRVRVRWAQGEGAQARALLPRSRRVQAERCSQSVGSALQASPDERKGGRSSLTSRERAGGGGEKKGSRGADDIERERESVCACEERARPKMRAQRRVDKRTREKRGSERRRWLNKRA